MIGLPVPAAHEAAAGVRWGEAQRQAGHDELPGRALLVPAIEAVFGEPALQRAEHLQPAGAQALPDVEQPGLDAVVGLGQRQPEVDVVLQQLPGKPLASIPRS